MPDAESASRATVAFPVPHPRIVTDVIGVRCQNGPSSALSTRCDGSVGLTVNAEIAVIDEARNIVTTDGEGAVVVRGDGVFSGYLGDAETSAAAFHDGWFRTGDFGRIELDGSLTLRGRLKEVISRGETFRTEARTAA